MSEMSKTNFVTGATGGIGLAVCNRLAKSGYSLLLSARDSARLQTLCAELSNAYSGKYSWLSVDMTNDDSIKGFATELNATNVILDGAIGA